jgi:hypothetical protein
VACDKNIGCSAMIDGRLMCQCRRPQAAVCHTIVPRTLMSPSSSWLLHHLGHHGIILLVAPWRDACCHCRVFAFDSAVARRRPCYGHPIASSSNSSWCLSSSCFPRLSH